MPLRVRIAARAARQVIEAAQWWTDNRPGAPGAVAADFEQAVRIQAVRILARHPRLGAEYSGSRTPGVRRLLLNRLGYFVYYKADGEALSVLAFWHARRERPPSL